MDPVELQQALDDVFDQALLRHGFTNHMRDYDDGLAIAPVHYTVTDAVRYWLQHGLAGRSATTVKMYTTYADKHVIPAVGARKLRDLSVEDVDRWLAGKTGELSTRSLKLIHGILNRPVKSAMRRDKVKRNVVDLCEIPDGREGRTSKALTLAQAGSIIALAEQASPRMRAYVVLSLLIGARTEELRAPVVSCRRVRRGAQGVVAGH